MCNCRKELTEKLTARAKEQLPDSTNHSVEIGGLAFTLEGGGMGSRDYLPVDVHHTVTVKKTGLQKQKVEKTKLLARFCMFCGEKQVND